LTHLRLALRTVPGVVRRRDLSGLHHVIGDLVPRRWPLLRWKASSGRLKGLPHEPDNSSVTDEAQEITDVLQRLEALVAKQRAERKRLRIAEVPPVAQAVGDVHEDSERFQPHHP